ncbi:MAG TPA: hypothetical protein VF781_06155 [Solirubrobacteraceae bacterium]
MSYRGLRWGVVVVAVLAALVCGAIVGAGGARSAVTVNNAAWYVGVTSAGTRIDFRTSPSGAWVRDFHFGSPELTRHGPVGEPMPDGNFPLVGLPIVHGAFAGDLEAADATPSNADAVVVMVSGHFDTPRQVTGTLQAADRGGGFDPLTFTATRAGALPALPTRGGRYFETPPGSASLSFQVSRSGRRVMALRIGSTLSECKYSDAMATFMLTRSYPAAGLRQGPDGSFSGVLSSRLTARGRPAGTRVRVTILFLSPTEATGTLRLLGGGAVQNNGSAGRMCGYETLPFRATISTQVVGSG